MGAFLGSIFGGSNSTLNKDLEDTGQQAGFDTGQGQGDITAGTDFLKDILSGDPTKQAQALAPEISSEKKSVQQDQKTGAMMGTRSGGTAAANVSAADKAHSDITDMLAKLTGTAATALPSIGTNLTAQGTAATQDEAKLAQQRMENWQKSILGQGITGATDLAESYV